MSVAYPGEMTFTQSNNHVSQSYSLVYSVISHYWVATLSYSKLIGYMYGRCNTCTRQRLTGEPIIPVMLVNVSSSDLLLALCDLPIIPITAIILASVVAVNTILTKQKSPSMFE